MITGIVIDGDGNPLPLVPIDAKNPEALHPGHDMKEAKATLGKMNNSKTKPVLNGTMPNEAAAKFKKEKHSKKENLVAKPAK